MEPTVDVPPIMFSSAERRFLAAAGRANAPADDLVDVLRTIDAERPPEIERVTYLTRELLRSRLFTERRYAYSCAQLYTTLTDAGADLTLVTWDWE